MCERCNVKIIFILKICSYNDLFAPVSSKARIRILSCKITGTKMAEARLTSFKNSWFIFQRLFLILVEYCNKGLY